MKSKLLLSLLIGVGLLTLGLLSWIENGWEGERSNINPLDNYDHVIITEIIAKNSSLLPDCVGNYVDLIELYNPTKEAVNLLGYGLSDEAGVPHKWQFSEVTIEPHSYLVVYAQPINQLDNPLNASQLNTKSDIEEQKGLYADFKLDASGESVALSNDEGMIIDQHRFGPLDHNMSYGIQIESNTKQVAYGYYLKGTPGRKNEGMVIQNINEFYKNIKIKPSKVPGVYSEEFDLTFNKNNEYDLRYTIDSSNPTSGSSLFDRSITIADGMLNPVQFARIPSTYYGGVNVRGVRLNRGTVVKAQYFNGDIPIGKMFVGTYFIFDEGPLRYDFDIVSLTTDPSNLFDPQNGIHVVGTKFEELAPEEPDGGTPANYNQRGRDWEREAYVEFFGEEGELFYNQSIGVRIFGGWSRANPKKSFKLIARSQYDELSTFEYSFFEDLKDKSGKEIDSFKSLILRSGGNDYEFTLFRDILTDELASGITESQAYKPVILFLNGEYWGIYNLREHMNENYVASHFEIDKEDISIIVYNSGIELDAGDDSEFIRFNKLLEEMNEADLKNDEVYAYFTEKIDINNMIDYYITQIYVNNMDWPGNNSKLWRYTGEIEQNKLENEVNYKDGRYRFLLYDTEFNFGLYHGVKSYAHNSFELLEDENSEVWPNFAWSTIMYRKFMENDNFRKLFLTRLQDLLNSRFDKDIVNNEIVKLKDLYYPEMEEYINRWNFWALNNLNDWETNQIYNLIAFADKRSASLFNMATYSYELEGHKKITIEYVQGVNINVNSSYDLDFQKPSGEILNQKIIKCFSDFPVQFRAEVEEGYEFIKWEIAVEEGEISDYMMEGTLESDTINLKPSIKMVIKPIIKKIKM